MSAACCADIGLLRNIGSETSMLQRVSTGEGTKLAVRDVLFHVRAVWMRRFPSSMITPIEDTTTDAAPTPGTPLSTPTHCLSPAHQNRGTHQGTEGTTDTTPDKVDTGHQDLHGEKHGQIITTTEFDYFHRRARSTALVAIARSAWHPFCTAVPEKCPMCVHAVATMAHWSRELGHFSERLGTRSGSLSATQCERKLRRSQSSRPSTSHVASHQFKGSGSNAEGTGKGTLGCTPGSHWSPSGCILTVVDVGPQTRGVVVQSLPRPTRHPMYPVHLNHDPTPAAATAAATAPLEQSRDDDDTSAPNCLHPPRDGLRPGSQSLRRGLHRGVFTSAHPGCTRSLGDTSTRSSRSRMHGVETPENPARLEGRTSSARSIRHANHK